VYLIQIRTRSSRFRVICPVPFFLFPIFNSCGDLPSFASTTSSRGFRDGHAPESSGGVHVESEKGLLFLSDGAEEVASGLAEGGVVCGGKVEEVGEGDGEGAMHGERGGVLRCQQSVIFEACT
jgi:hypothetical protein